MTKGQPAKNTNPRSDQITNNETEGKDPVILSEDYPAVHESVLKNIPGIIYRNRLDGSPAIISGAMAITGYSVSDFATEVVSWVGLIHPDDIDRVVKDASEMNNSQRELIHEYRILHADGTYRWVQAREYSVFDEAGTFQFVDGIVLDITAQRETEFALRDEEEKFRTILESIPEGISVTDDQGVIQVFNSSFSDITGYDPSDVIGRRPTDFVHPEDRERAVGRIRSLMTGADEGASEYRLIQKSGVEIVIEVLSRKITYRSKPAVLAVVTDVTERNEAALALEESEERYRSLFENANVGMFRSMIDGSAMLAVNQKACDITGWKKDEILDNPTSIHWANPSDRVRLTEMLLAEGKVSDFETDLLTTKGMLRTVLLSAYPNIDKGWYEGTIVDITERKAVEKELDRHQDDLEKLVQERTAALGESDSRFREMFNTIKSGVAVYEAINEGEDFRFVDFNPAAEKIEGIAATEVIGKSLIEAYPGVEEFGLLKVLREVYKTGEPSQLPAALYSAPGPIPDVWKENFVYKLPSGEIVAIFDDVTQRINDENALRVSEERFSTAFHASADSITLTSLADGLFIDVNEAFEKIFKITKEEAIGKTSVDLKLWSEPKLRVEIGDMLRAGKKIRDYEFVGRRTSGELFDGLASVEIVQVEGVECLLTTLRDVTEQNKDRQGLKEASEFREKLVAESPIGTAIYDAETGQCLVANRALAEIVGATVEQLLAQNFRKIESWQTSGLLESADRALKNDTKESTSVSMTTTFGKEINIDVHFAPLKVGEKQYLLYSGIDVTERIEAQEIQKILNEKINRAAKMESLGMIAGGVAHDLNNVLVPIAAYPDLIMASLPDDSPVVEDLEQIKQAAGAAASIISDLLSLARRGKYEMQPILVDQLIHSTVESPAFKQMRAEQPQVSVNVEVPDDLLNISGSESHLLTAIMNLVVNGFQSFDSSGGSLTLSAFNLYNENQKFGYDIIPEGEFVVVEVEDQGAGISKENLESIFEPFYSTKQKSSNKGTGLGLSIVHGVISDHDAFVDVTSEVGKGTKFCLFFPVNRDEIERETHSERDYRGTESIVIIDDIEAQTQLVTRILADIGYQVTAITSGEAAIEYLHDHSADLVVIDMLMGDGLDGLATYEEILKIHPKQKAIVVSGFSESDRVKRALALGAHQYVRKPYAVDNLRKAVRETLDA